MKQVEITLKHIRILYFAFLAVLVIDISYGLYSSGYADMIESFKEGQKIARDEYVEPGDVTTKRVYITSLHNIARNPQERADVKQVVVNDSKVQIEVETTEFDAKFTSNEQPLIIRLLHSFFMFIGAVSIIWAVVLTVMLILNLGRSIVRKDIFNMRTIRLCRWYAVMIAIASVSYGISTYIDEAVVADYLRGTEWEFTPSLPLNLSGMTVALMVYIFSEILKIGHTLTQEQELTI